MQRTITIVFEDDQTPDEEAYVLNDMVTIIETMLGYLVSNVIITSTTEGE